jgi:hypothetical protein
VEEIELESCSHSDIELAATSSLEYQDMKVT